LCGVNPKKFFYKLLVCIQDLREEATSRFMKNIPPLSQRTDEHFGQISRFYAALKEKVGF